MERTTVILVHGAFAESASWNGVISPLLAQGYDVVAVANPLRSVSSDAAYLARLMEQIPGPMVLVGHSYGGMVINDAAVDNPRVKALVFVASFAPEAGESAAELSGRFPGGTLGPTLAPPVALPDGSNDLYIKQSDYHAQFCADVPEEQARLMAATQRPITDVALNEAASGSAWKTIPSYFIFGDLDKNIPAAGMRWMAERAQGREIIEIAGGSHVVGISAAGQVAALIVRAAASVEQQATLQSA
jgi:pimeloyl-ACP methyl ester carboxylesterase